jgi:DNA-binding transcriptional ArsR family regulator
MPAFETDLVRTPVKTTISIALEPALNLFNSLLLLSKAEHLSGLNEWVTRTAASMTPEQRWNHRIVLEGLHHAIKPTRRWPSFPAFIDHLASQDPFDMRDRILATYAHFCCDSDETEADRFEVDQALSSLDSFLEFLRAGFPDEAIDVQIESEAYALLKDPPALRERVVSHLRTMWTELLEPEWERNLPMLQACVDAFRQIDFGEKSVQEVAHQITGQEIPEKWASVFEKEFEQVIFVPSAHLGPYRGMYKVEQTLWLQFGARLPEGSRVSSPDLSRSELLVRLSALADDTRLHILQSLKEQGELCSKDIIQQLELSQSAASRHLKQLSATGYLSVRRKNGAKCYSLSEERVDDTLEALSHFLLG